MQTQVVYFTCDEEHNYLRVQKCQSTTTVNEGSYFPSSIDRSHHVCKVLPQIVLTVYLLYFGKNMQHQHRLQLRVKLFFS